MWPLICAQLYFGNIFQYFLYNALWLKYHVLSTRITYSLHLYASLTYHIYPTLPLGQDMTRGQFFKRSLTGLNSEFSYYLQWNWSRILLTWRIKDAMFIFLFFSFSFFLFLMTAKPSELREKALGDILRFAVIWLPPMGC